MLIIVSNNGNWDHDMWGTVGAIASVNYADVKKEFVDFVKNDQLDNDEFDEDYINYVEGEEHCLASFEENEVSFLCNGTPLSFIQYQDDDCFADIYYLVDLPASKSK